ncbi:MAG: phosphonate C-P lyase system protein PhnH [Actinomycetota bacterium]
MTGTYPTGTDVGGEPPDGELVRAARLEGVRSQQAFGVLLDSLSRPGSIHRIPTGVLVDGLPPALVLALATADVEVTVAVLRSVDEPDWARLLSDATGARIAPIEAAGCVTALVAPSPDDIEVLRRGTALAPESAARLALSVTALTDGSTAADDVVVGLQGPGVDGSITLGVTGIGAEVVEALALANAAFPAGVDTWLVSDGGDVAAIPRSTSIEVRHRAATTSGGH